MSSSKYTELTSEPSGGSSEESLSRFDDRLRRISTALFGTGMLVVLLVANSGLVHSEGMDREALNWLVAVASVSIVGILLFPWHWYNRYLFVNDSLGHEAGDRLLVAVAERLRACLRPEDTAVRFGGDEFVVLLEDVASADGAAQVAERIVQELLRAPFALREREVFVTPSIGIVLSDSRNDSPKDLLRDADTAMYQAKEEGKACYQVFEPNIYEGVVKRLKLENDLRRVMEREELKVHCQPQVLLEGNKIVGFEALVRWERPKCGRLNPSEFVPLAEEIGLIIPIGRHILREACRQAKDWQERYPKDTPLKMSVNLSLRQLQRPDLFEKVETVLRETGLTPSSLVLEVTKNVAMKDAESTLVALRKLKG